MYISWPPGPRKRQQTHRVPADRNAARFGLFMRSGKHDPHCNYRPAAPWKRWGTGYFEKVWLVSLLSTIRKQGLFFPVSTRREDGRQQYAKRVFVYITAFFVASVTKTPSSPSSNPISRNVVKTAASDGSENTSETMGRVGHRPTVYRTTSVEVKLKVIAPERSLILPHFIGKL